MLLSHFLASELFPFLFLCPLGLATTTAAILLYKSQILRFLNPRLLFKYWRGSVKGVAVSKPSTAALSKVSKPNVDCILIQSLMDTTLCTVYRQTKKLSTSLCSEISAKFDKSCCLCCLKSVIAISLKTSNKQFLCKMLGVHN